MPAWKACVVDVRVEMTLTFHLSLYWKCFSRFAENMRASLQDLVTDYERTGIMLMHIACMQVTGIPTLKLCGFTYSKNTLIPSKPELVGV